VFFGRISGVCIELIVVPSTAMTPPPELRGAVLGRGYRLGRAVEGEEAVFEATHERVPGKVLVRVFPNESLARPDAGARIHQAVRLASLLRSTHALQLLDFNLAGDTPAFVVTERVEGRTLAKVMAEDGMLSLPATLQIVEAIASAVQAAHRLGLTHGDLRAALIVVPDGAGAAAKVGGFGWAKELRAAAIQPAPPGLLAPEQHGGRVVTIDPRADQYGLAGLAYEMLAACPPFPEEPAGAEPATREPSPLGDLVPGIPRAIDDVLHRALSQRPRDRFEDIAAFAARLRQAAAHAPITVPLAALPALAVPHTHRNGERNGTRRSAPELAMPSALPTFPVASDEVTEEMDRHTLWPLVAKADSGGTISSRIQREDSLDIDLLGHVASEKGYGSDIEFEMDIGSGELAHASSGSRPYPIDAAAIAEMLDSQPTPPPEVATLVQQSPFMLPAVQAEAQTPPPVTPPLQLAMPGTAPWRAAAPHLAVPAELPRRSSQPHAAVPAELPRRASQPHAAVPAELPRRPSAPYSTVPVELPRRPSAPYSTVPAESPRRPSQPHAALSIEPATPPSTAWAAPGPTPFQPVVAPQDRYFVQPVEINLGLPPAPPAVPPAARLRTLGYGTPRPGPQQLFRAYDAPLRPFTSDAADYMAPAAASGKWKRAVGVAVVVVALGAAWAMKGRLSMGREPAPAPPVVAATPGQDRIFAGAPSAIIAPVEPQTADAASNGLGDCAVRITSNPAAVVLIDGKDTGHSTPLLGFRVTCGLHRLLLRHPDTGLQRGDIMKVVPGRPYTANYTFGSVAGGPSPEAAVDSIPARLAGKHAAARRHTHRKHRQPRPVLQYVDEFE
jgi:serine/threonine protein kinase